MGTTKLKGLNSEKMPEFKKALKHYFVALAINETNIKIDTDSKKEVLKENIFYFLYFTLPNKSFKASLIVG